MATGEQEVKEIYRRLLQEDRKPLADLVATVARALGGPKLSPMDATESENIMDRSDDALYERIAPLLGISPGGESAPEQSSEKAEDEELYEAAMSAMGRRG